MLAIWRSHQGYMLGALFAALMASTSSSCGLIWRKIKQHKNESRAYSGCCANGWCHTYVDALPPPPIFHIVWDETPQRNQHKCALKCTHSVNVRVWVCVDVCCWVALLYSNREIWMGRSGGGIGSVNLYK